MAQNHFSPTNKDSLTVHHANLTEGAAIKESLIAQQRGLSHKSVEKKFFTTADQRQVHDLGKVIAANVTGVLEA